MASTLTRYAIYGAGGFGKEVKGMLDHMKQDGLPLLFAGYLDDYKKELDIAADSFDDVLFAIARPEIRESVVKKMEHKNLSFSSLISKDIFIHPSVVIGRGSIICPGVRFTVDISIGEFVIINLNATIGHDVRVGDYCSIMPSANISGNVSLGKGVLVGSGATILQGLTIGEDAVIGAGAIVTHSVPARVTVMGVQARERN